MPAEFAEKAPPDKRPPIRVLLYTLITTANQQTPIKRNPVTRLRNRLVRLAYLIFWKVTGVWKAPFWIFEDVCNSNLGDVAVRLGVSSALRKAFSDKNLEIHEVPWGELTPRLINDNRHNFDFIVVGGGGYLFADRNNLLPKRVLNGIQALEHAKCPVVATSIGLNQLIQGSTDSKFRFHPDQGEVICRFVDRLALSSVRDRTTQAAIEAVGAKAPLVIVDPAFLLVNPEPQIERTDDDVMDIGLNIPFHGHFTSTLSQRSLVVLVRALKKLEGTMPCRFHYFCHADSEKGIVAALRVSGIKINVVGGSVSELLDGYRKLDVHVGSLMHSTILAMSAGVPSLALAYDIKSVGFFELFGLDGLVKNIQTMDEEKLHDEIVELVAKRHHVAAVIEQRGSELRKEAEEFYARVAKLVNCCIWTGCTSIQVLVELPQQVPL